MTFKKWVSGNPAGRPVWARSVETLFRDAIKKIAEDNKIEDIERDLIISLLSKAKQGDIRALEIYLDRLYGKPKQSTDITSGGEMIQAINVNIVK